MAAKKQWYIEDDFSKSLAKFQPVSCNLSLPTIWQMTYTHKLPKLCRATLSYVQTDATTPNIVGPTMLGVVTSVLAVVCKRMQQLPTMLGPAVHGGKDTTHKTLETTCVMRVRGPKNFGRAVQTDPTVLRYASAITERKKCWVCWFKRLTGFKLCATTPNNT